MYDIDKKTLNPASHSLKKTKIRKNPNNRHANINCAREARCQSTKLSYSVWLSLPPCLNIPVATGDFIVHYLGLTE
jgi:hypothetical protein